jgi:nucleotide-binding universal stress UspA family protein
MNQIISSEPGLSALKPKTTVAYAGALELIEKVASEAKVDLIVVGSHGASGLELLALGSVAKAVLRQATCPVLSWDEIAKRNNIHSAPLSSLPI